MTIEDQWTAALKAEAPDAVATVDHLSGEHVTSNGDALTALLATQGGVTVGGRVTAQDIQRDGCIARTARAARRGLAHELEGQPTDLARLRPAVHTSSQ